jgi:hypothetical protein
LWALVGCGLSGLQLSQARGDAGAVKAGFSLSAVGMGSALRVDDVVSSAARDHELGAYLSSQQGSWLIVADEVMLVPHPVAFDQWEAVRVKARVAKPCVIWHDRGRVLGIDAVAGMSSGDLLELAKSRVPGGDDSVVIRGKVRLLGRKPEMPARTAGALRLSAVLRPIAAEECGSVDLSSQVLSVRDQVAGTCVLQSFVGACESAHYCLYGRQNRVLLSAYFLAALTDGYDGTWASTAAEAVQRFGNVRDSEFKPYQKLPRDYREKGQEFRVVALYGPPESDSPGYLRASLKRGYTPCAGISVGSGFDPDSDGYISYARGAGRSINHEVRVVAWDKDKRRFRICNSWGEEWGVGGFAWLDERFFVADSDLWVVVCILPGSSAVFEMPTTADGSGVAVDGGLATAGAAAGGTPASGCPSCDGVRRRRR